MSRIAVYTLAESIDKSDFFIETKKYFLVSIKSGQYSMYSNINYNKKFIRLIRLVTCYRIMLQQNLITESMKVDRILIKTQFNFPIVNCFN